MNKKKIQKAVETTGKAINVLYAFTMAGGVATTAYLASENRTGEAVGAGLITAVCIALKLMENIGNGGSKPPGPAP